MISTKNELTNLWGVVMKIPRPALLLAMFTTASGEVAQNLKQPPLGSSAQRVPEPDQLPGISFDPRPDPIQF